MKFIHFWHVAIIFTSSHYFQYITNIFQTFIEQKYYILIAGETQLNFIPHNPVSLHRCIRYNYQMYLRIKLLNEQFIIINDLHTCLSVTKIWFSLFLINNVYIFFLCMLWKFLFL